MGKVIKFSRSETKLKSLLSERIESGISSLPKDLADCLRNSLIEISSFSIVKQKSFDLVVSDNLPEEDLSTIKEGVEEIIKAYEKDVLPVLERLAEKEAELCMLKSICNQ
jgi:hypothetical protein